MAKVSKITVDQEVTKVVEETRYIVELTWEEADLLHYVLSVAVVNMDSSRNIENAEAIRDALYDSGVRFAQSP